MLFRSYFLKVSSIRDLDPEAFADDYREEQELMPKLNEEYYGELKDNPDEEVVDDSLAMDMYDHDTNEFKNQSPNAKKLIQNLELELSGNDVALKILAALKASL